MRVILATGLALVVSASASAQTTLYVNSATGNDSVSRANNSAATPWRSIGRAAWGSTNRDAPNAAEAARAGDTVEVAGGTYAFSGSIGDRWGVVYTTANSGTAGNYITFTCVGDCVLTAPNANSPVIGAAGRNYIKWFADVTQGHSWVINACGHTTDCGTNHVNTTPDTGPVVCNATGCWVEGAVIDGGPAIDYRDNWNAIRIENCTSCVVRNNTAANFTRAASAGGTNHNQSIITMYGTLNSIIEHNVGSNSGAGVYFKDTGSTNPQSGNMVRFNRFENVNEVIAFSLIRAENRNYVYQNIGMNARLGVAIVADGLSNDWIFNNTFYRMSSAAISPTTAGTGGRFWNNICLECGTAIYTGPNSMPASSIIDLQHNVYSGHNPFYSGGDGNRSLASFRSAFPGQESAAPATVEANPLFVNAAGRDFRLCTGAGAPAASCTGASPAIGRGVDLYDLDRDGNTTEAIRAGAYITNTEMIGLSAPMPWAPTNLRVVVGSPE